MAVIAKVIFCALFVFCLIDIGYGLSCLSCYSKDITDKCRLGSRSTSPKLETCHGRKARCYATATVTDDGEASFERGCSKKEVCIENNDDVEFCFTCGYNNCNYDYMELDPEVEDYLLGKLETSTDEVDFL